MSAMLFEDENEPPRVRSYQIQIKYPLGIETSVVDIDAGPVDVPDELREYYNIECANTKRLLAVLARKGFSGPFAFGIFTSDRVMVGRGMFLEDDGPEEMAILHLVVHQIHNLRVALLLPEGTTEEEVGGPISEVEVTL